MKPVLIALLLALGTEVVAAQSLKIRQLQRDESASLAQSAVRLETECGKAIPAEIDWSSFGEADYREGYSVAGYCESGAVSAIAWMCADELAREAITKKIERLQCSIGAERRATLRDDGTYAYSFTWDDSNAFNWHQDFLGDNL